MSTQRKSSEDRVSQFWFWNTSPEGLFNTNGGLNFFKTASSIQKQNKADKAWNEAYNTSHPSQKALDAFDWSDLLLMEKGVHAKSPNQNGSPGFALRPCHPKAEGHGAINDALKAEIDKDFSGGGINCKH